MTLKKTSEVIQDGPPVVLDYIPLFSFLMGMAYFISWS